MFSGPVPSQTITTTLEDQLTVLRKSAARAAGIAATLDAAQLRSPAYPTEWTVADVFSHLGSAAVVMRARVEAGVAGSELADDFGSGSSS